MWYHVVPTGLFLAVVTSFKEIQISDNDPSVSIGISKEFLPPKDARTDEKFENMKYKIKKYESYEIPTPQIELLQPKGFRISIPDVIPNITRLLFFGNINTMSFPGALIGYTEHASNGSWVYENKRVALKHRDTVFFQTALVDHHENLHAGVLGKSPKIYQVNFYADVNERLLTRKKLDNVGLYSGFRTETDLYGNWIYTYRDVQFKDGDVLYYSVLIYTVPYCIMYEKQKEYFLKIKVLNGVPTIVANGTIHKRYLERYYP